MDMDNSVVIAGGRGVYESYMVMEKKYNKDFFKKQQKNSAKMPTNSWISVTVLSFQIFSFG